MSTLLNSVKYISHFSRNRIPGQVVIQTTNRCNAICPQCGMRRTASIHRSSLSTDTIQRILKACAEKGIQAVSFTGGEPMLDVDRLIQWITFAGRLGIPYIRTGTNGFVFRGAERPDFSDRMKRLAERLAQTSLRNFWISLDSHIPEVHEQMRGLNGVVKGIEKALPIFHAAGIYPSANLGLNRMVGGEQTKGLQPTAFLQRDVYLNEFHFRFKDALERFYRFVKDLGFTIVNTCYPMSISEAEKASGLNAVYSATAVEDVVRFTTDEKAMLFKALFDTIPAFRSQLRIFSPLSSIYMLYRSYTDGLEAVKAFGCRGGIDFFFIDAVNADTYPCGYRGNENLGKIWQMDIDALRPQKDCHRCDWECFRDPSELCAPFLEMLHEPVKLVGKMVNDPLYRRLWLEDLRYYRRCHLFDGRRPMDTARLNHYSVPSSSKNITALTPA